MSVPLVLYMLFFSYYPLTGWSMAFQNYKPQIRSIWEQEWVGFANFTKLFQGLYGEQFLRSVRNTFGQSLLTLVLGTFCAIGLSLLINEVRHMGFKRIVQNISYLPHFLSWIIATGMIATALSLPSSGGIINTVLMNLNIISEPIAFLQKPEYFWWIVAFGNLWKSLGWNTIIYLAAMTAIDPSLYEAADIDGANRYQKMCWITLPSIKPTIVILLIMATGQLLQSGFELQYFLGGSVTAEMAENIDIFVLKYGIQLRDYSLATVAGIMKTGVSFVFVFAANYLAGKLGSEKLI
ncbi:ABC transporter permease [Kineothrix sp. MB12-C1]|uniref:ABC transporter permease n=1 Tax=Kineothrix sp. MB12-C1 TaxID=3070215 RepID=UPI0027D32C1B|nr:ABC transporter permease subunit [Kineothrix sp. MB12-C1]WMC93322.1 ABC transporter permease subunit [Kineothrix sp. MB12-C1]